MGLWDAADVHAIIAARQCSRKNCASYGSAALVTCTEMERCQTKLSKYVMSAHLNMVNFVNEFI